MDLLGFLCFHGACRGSRPFCGGDFSPRNQFDCNEFGCITNPAPGFDHPGITARTILKPYCNIAEQFRHDVLAPEKAECASPGWQGTLFPQRDHPIGETANLFCLGFGGFDSLVLQQRSDEAPEQGPTMFRLSTELSALFSMTHDILFFLLGLGTATRGHRVELDPETQSHISENFLDFIQGLLAKVLGFQHFGFRLLHQISNGLDIGIL